MYTFGQVNITDITSLFAILKPNDSIYLKNIAIKTAQMEKIFILLSK